MTTIKIDASGERGVDGPNGRSFVGQRAAVGQRGRDGGHAGDAQPGQHAGRIDVELRTSSVATGLIEIRGNLERTGDAPRTVGESLPLSSDAAIELLACGGPGGHGGNGGDGEEGGPGQRGTDATRWSSGTDGSPGGDGGRGGNGTRGAPGGNGGQITVRVDRRDTHLLMLVAHGLNGGVGGAPGKNGDGGSGGPGGDGGAPFSWTTESVETYTDAQGHQQSRTVSIPHHNPGGAQGRRGRSGNAGQAILSAGPAGQPGSLRIVVNYDGRTAQFSRRYDVEMTNYDLELSDAFAEPTSEIRIRKVTVRNVGGMPTPESHPIIVQLPPGPWLAPSGAPLSLDRSLAPDESHSFDTELVAHVPDVVQPAQGEPLRATDEVWPYAVQSGVDRPFANGHPKKSFDIAFPAELEAIRSLESQTPGQAARLRITVANRSRHALGEASPGKRLLRLQIQLANQELAPFLVLLDHEGNRVDWRTGFAADVCCVEPGQSATFETVIGVLPDAPGYERAAFQVSMALGQLEAPSAGKIRHQRPFTLRIAQSYRFDPAAEILLIANHETTTEEKQAWERLAARLGKRINIWDISLNDALTLSETLAHGQDLLRDFHGKMIVLSNAPFDTPLGIRYGDQFLGQMDLIKATESHHIRLFLLNDARHDIAHLFGSRLIPTDGTPEFHYTSLAQFRRSQPENQAETVLERVREIVEHGAKAAEPNPIEQTSRIAIYGVRSPNLKRLRRQAEKLQRELENSAPGRRFVVMYALPPRPGTPPATASEIPPTAPGGWFFTHVHQGTLTVMPTLGDRHPNLIAANVAVKEIHEGTFIGGPIVTSGMILSLRFQDKVALLDAILRELAQPATDPTESPPALGSGKADSLSSDLMLCDVVIDAILVDLAVEQGAVLKTGWRPLFFGRQIHAALEKLQFLADFPLKLMMTGEDSRAAGLVLKLVAGVDFLGRNARRWYDGWWFPWGPFRRGPALRHETLDAAQRLIKNLFRTLSPEQHKTLREHARQFEKCRKVVQQKSKLSASVAARRAMTYRFHQMEMRLDVEQPFSRVLSAGDWQAIQEAEARREEMRLELQREKRRNQSEFQVAVDGQPVAGLDERTRRAIEAILPKVPSQGAPVRERAVDREFDG